MSTASIFQNDCIKIRRDEHGVPHIEAQSEADLYWGAGYCHALDRGMQMLLMRILGRGQASALLDSSEEMLAIDKFFRRMNWYGGLERELAKLTEEAQRFCQAYGEGANAYFAKHIPWELKLLGYRPSPWESRDLLLLARMVGYLTLAQSQAEITFYENDRGTLEGDPFDEGFYLTTKWAPAEGGAQSINYVFKMFRATNVEEGMNTLGRFESAFNFVLADRHGNIGYQMSGAMPKRRAGVSGFVPLLGWKQENQWLGFVDFRELPRCLNPAEGFFVTANNDLNRLGAARPSNNAMGSYRADRIAQLLAQNSRATLEDIKKIHYEVYSLQAEAFMKILRPLLPDTPQGRILRAWDFCYDLESQGAFLFEAVYQALL